MVRFTEVDPVHWLVAVVVQIILCFFVHFILSTVDTFIQFVAGLWVDRCRIWLTVVRHWSSVTSGLRHSLTNHCTWSAVLRHTLLPRCLLKSGQLTALDHYCLNDGGNHTAIFTYLLTFLLTYLLIMQRINFSLRPWRIKCCSDCYNKLAWTVSTPRCNSDRLLLRFI